MSLSAELLISIGGYRFNREMGARALLALPVLSLSLEGTTKRGKGINCKYSFLTRMVIDHKRAGHSPLNSPEGVDQCPMPKEIIKMIE